MPYLTQIAAAAIPAFTSKPETAKSDPVVSRQIEELQSAATQNAQSIQVLANKLQQAILDIESAAQAGRKQVAAYKAMILVSLGLSVISVGICIYVLLL
jgi:hypothetical protein